MTPSLVALGGPLQGRTFDLTGDGAAVGRHPANDLTIPDGAVSRHHCALRRTADGWQVADLDSRQGTFLNGTPVREARLAHGDVLGIGESTFLVLLDDPRGEVPAPDEADLVGGTEIRVTAGDSVYLRPAPSDQGSAARALAALLDLAAACGEPRDAAALARASLERILAAIPAERGAFVLVEGGEPEPLAFRQRGATGPGRPFAFSRSLADRSLGERAAILHSTGQAAAASESVIGVRSAACAPLLESGGGGSPLGFLYLETRGAGGEMGEDHLQWLSAAGALIAPPLAALLRLARAEAESLRLQESVLGRGLVGESPALRRAADILARSAPTASTVLILGESGTGKEMAARALHAASPRAGKPFVAINCASLSENLLESELFGHEQGAFTGAVTRKTGKLEVAHGGTLFLDEVGELPQPLQAKLLRVLQERTFERVGGTRPITVDLRLVAATNRDLKKAVAEGTFRDDLFYRLNVISLTMPALRERREDIPLLASHFASVHGRAVRGRPVAISPAARSLLVRHDWPGNVRELSNAVERAVVLGLGEEILPEDLPETLLETAGGAAPGGAETPAAPSDYHAALNEAKRRIIREALAAAGGNVTRAAEGLGLHANHLHRLITSLGLR